MKLNPLNSEHSLQNLLEHTVEAKLVRVDWPFHFDERKSPTYKADNLVLNDIFHGYSSFFPCHEKKYVPVGV